MNKILRIETTLSKQVLNITDDVNLFIKESKVKEGVCYINVLHTTCALTTVELDPGTDLDYLDAFYKMVPKLNYRHEHNPEHMPDHILSTMIGTSLVVQIREGVAFLGTWQNIGLFEFDGPKERLVALKCTEG